jgi:hypothetical protein
VGISKLMAKLECSKSAAVLYALNEGLYKEGAISQEDHDLLAKRYSRKLKDVIAEKQTKKEPSHIPVLTIEQRKEAEKLKQKDQQFKGILKQWVLHSSSAEWKVKIFNEAEKWSDKLQSARDILALKDKESAI